MGLLGVLAFVVKRFYDAGQFEGDKWEVFVTPDYVRVILVDGLLNTLKMAAVAIVGARSSASCWAWPSSPTTPSSGGRRGSWSSSSAPYRCCC